MRHLVVCLDGTGNSPIQEDVLFKSNNEVFRNRVESNVFKLWCTLTNNKDSYNPSSLLFGKNEYKYYGLVSTLDVGEGFEGEALYINGVGTQGSANDELIDGATGTGTSTRIRDAYRFLAERYHKTDKIYIFGFSRGAFAARSLAAFIKHVGLPKSRRTIPEEEIPNLWKAYRYDELYKGGLESSLYDPSLITIEFLGLWDTVGSLAFQKTFNKFHKISPTGVLHVRHALALDETRPHFKPSYWKAADADPKKVREVWFCGVHSNIGGGYQNTELSNISYIWMLRELAEVCQFMGDLEKLTAYVGEAGGNTDWSIIRDSYKEFYSGFKIVLAVLGGGEYKRQILPNQYFHPSVFEWISSGGYTPKAYINKGRVISLHDLAKRVQPSLDWIMDVDNEAEYSRISKSQKKDPQ
ncbi:DUF2235 domain-containing protein [Pseudomonas izuensis]|uniref:DUF2235 domain-containing protein n=1 Tax=Pseudomonas izuensis TaxID=2684212 RepID=UPI00135BB895|nr:DUF2235 domain-containing protein [Pseudomonas izuensis]